MNQRSNFSHFQSQLHLSIVVPTRGDLTKLGGLLSSLEAYSSRDQETRFEVLICSNRSLDREPLTLKQCSFPAQWFLTEPGANAARNKGIIEAQAALVLLLDDDVRLPRETLILREVVQAHQTFPSALAIGGLYRSQDKASIFSLFYNEMSNDWVLSSANKKQEISESAEDFKHEPSFVECDQLLGGFLSLKKKGLSSKILFDGQIHFGATESEWCQRVRGGGHTLLLASHWFVEHDDCMNARRLFKKARLQGFHSAKYGIQGKAHFRLRPSLQRPAFLYAWGFNRGHRDGTGGGRLGQAFSQWLFALRDAWVYRQTQKKESLEYGRNQLLGLVREVHWKSLEESFVGRDAAINYPVQKLLVSGDWWRFSEVSLLLRNTSNILVVRLIDWATVSTQLNEPLKGLWLLRMPVARGRRLHAKDIVGLKKKILEQGHSLPQVELMLGGLKGFQKAVELLMDEGFFHIHLNISSTVNLNLLHRELVKLKSKWPLFEVSGPFGDELMDERIPQNAELWPSIRPSLVKSSVHSNEEEQSIRMIFSVIIPAYKARNQLIAVLRHLQEAKRRWMAQHPHQEIEFLVVDDGSDFETENLMRHFIHENEGLEIKYFSWARSELKEKSNSLWRAGLARNLGASQARGEFLVFMDADILCPPDFFFELQISMTSAEVVQFRREMLKPDRGANVCYDELRSEHTYSQSEYWENFKAAERWEALHAYWKYTCTYCLAVRAHHFWAAGAFRRHFITYGYEDVDLGYRFHRTGLRFYLNKIPVFHLYPERGEMEFHTGLKRRLEALSQSAGQFYRYNVSYEVYCESAWVLDRSRKFVLNYVVMIPQLLSECYWGIKRTCEPRFWQMASAAKKKVLLMVGMR